MNEVNFKVALFLILFLGSCSYCAQYIAPLEFEGVVKDKYLSSYKNTPVIIVDVNGEEIEFGPDGKDTLALYQHLHIGDSLLKRKGSYSFIVIRHGERKTYTMNCDLD